MLPKNCGRLLYNAVRETLEIMAFADVIPCSIKVAGEEVAQDADFAVITDTSVGVADGWGEASDSQDPVDTWGTAAPDVLPPEESWGDSPEPTSADAPIATDDWGTADNSHAATNDAAWGRSGIDSTSNLSTTDPWGDAGLADACAEGHRPKEADFDGIVVSQTEWCWACMKVNSPDIHSVWFIIPQSLAAVLMQNMYAGETVEMDTPIVRDLIAELTNVLGGRLMLLLEELGGEFTLTVPDIGFGLPDISEAYSSQGIVCKVVVDNEHPVIVALCFNPGGVLALD
jgi:hypothetical protein